MRRSSQLASMCGAMWLALSSAALAQAHSIKGSVVCEGGSKHPPLSFKPAMAVGYFVPSSGAFNLTVFADKLTTQELRYWVSQEASARGGWFEGKEPEMDGAMDKRFKEFNKRQVQLWGELKEHSRHAPAEGSQDAPTYPATHQVADMTGMQLTACSNWGYLNAGLDAEAVAAVFKQLQLPTPTAAPWPQQPVAAQMHLQYSYKSSNGSLATIQLSGTVPVYVVPVPKPD